MKPSPLHLTAFLLLVASCGPGEPDPGAGRVTVGEAKALDDAAAMLDTPRSSSDGGATVSSPPPPTPTRSARP